MRGVVEARGDDKWRVRVFAGREGGKVRWVSRTIVATKRQAQVALAKLVTEVEAGQATRSHPTSVAEQLDRWLADIAPGAIGLHGQGASSLHRARHQAGARVRSPRQADGPPARRLLPRPTGPGPFAGIGTQVPLRATRCPRPSRQMGHDPDQPVRPRYATWADP